MADTGVTLGPEALRQVRETVRRVLSGWQNERPGGYRKRVASNLHVAIDTDLDAPTSATGAPTTCQAFVLQKNTDGSLVTTDNRITVTNWDPALTLTEGTVCKVEWIGGRWEVYWASCTPDAEIITEIEAIRELEEGPGGG